MADSLLLFDVFGEHTTKKTAKNVLRQPLCNENMGKAVAAGPVKLNEPTKKPVKPSDAKKSFLSNAGKVLQSTPARQVFSPKVMKASSIYTEDDEGIFLEEIEFTKPSLGYNIYCDPFDNIFETVERHSPATPPPQIGEHIMEFHSFNDDDFPNDFSMDSLPDEDLGLPDIY